MQFVKLVNTCGIIVLITRIAISPAAADTEISKTLDCTKIELEAVIDKDVSREENLERLSQQFFQSVNTIERCDRTPKVDSSEASTANGDAATSSSNGATFDNDSDSGSAKAAKRSINQMSAQTDPENDSTGSINATASNSLIGTNFDQNLGEAKPAFGSSMAGTTPQQAALNRAAKGSTNNKAEQDLILTNGKTPDDIPDPDNDSILEAQIRAAAIAETDPNTQKNLWNEYRRYKGLPKQE